MGNIFSEKNEGKESVISLSDNCVSRITKDEKKCASSKPNELNDADWVKKLKCMDDIHSQQNGITYQCVMDLIKLIEEDLCDYRPPVCDRTALITCLKKNENCMIRCKEYIDEFIGCVDAHRINIIKEKFEMDKKNKYKEGNELAKQFLKDN